MIRNNEGEKNTVVKKLFTGGKKQLKKSPGNAGRDFEYEESEKASAQQKKKEERINRSEEKSEQRSLASRQLSRRVFTAMSAMDKINGRRSDKIKNARRESIEAAPQEKKQGKKLPGFLNKIGLAFVAVVHWGKQRAFKSSKKPKPMSRFAIIGLAALVMAVASGGVALAAAMFSGEEITIPIIAKPKSPIVQVSYGETTIEISSLSETVGDMLIEHDITFGEYDTISPSLETPIEDGLAVVITRAFPVHIKHDGETTTVKATEGTVADALKLSKVEYDKDDLISPSMSTKLKAGLNIKLQRVEVITEVETHIVEFEIENGETNTVNEGLWHLEQKGEDGEVEITTAITLVDGEEVSREITEKVIKEPKKEIRLWGTAIPQKNDSSSSSDSDSDTDYEAITVSNPGEQATNPSVPAAPSSYLEKVTVHATAYSHTGRTTATGTWPRSTRTLENPGSCAVVPSTFPYGSLLYVVGYGYCIAEDTGGFRHNPDRWNQVDLFMNTEEECVKWGRRREWTAYVLRKGR